MSRLARGQTVLGLAALLLVLGMMAVKRPLGQFRRENARSGASLAGVFTAGEQIAASLLGGFRSFLINMLWVRIQDRLDRGEHLELPFLYRAVEELQGSSPLLFQRQSRNMILDIPLVLRDEPEERWRWIVRGLRVLERGLERFPGDPDLLREGGFVYLLRFHPLRYPADRERFLRDRDRTGANPRGEDPLTTGAAILERALAMKEHTFDVDMTYWLTQALWVEVLLGEGGRGLHDPDKRARLLEALEEATRHLQHVRAVHREGLEVMWLEAWEKQLGEFRDALEG